MKCLTVVYSVNGTVLFQHYVVINVTVQITVLYLKPAGCENIFRSVKDSQDLINLISIIRTGLLIC